MAQKQVWRSKLDALAGKICKYQGRCLRCRSTYQLEWAHILTRGYYRIRWDFDNCICLCHNCHRYYTVRPAEWALYIKEKFGEDFWWSLHRRATDYMQPKVDYDEVYQTLKAEWARIQGLSYYNHHVEHFGLSRTQL